MKRKVISSIVIGVIIFSFSLAFLKEIGATKAEKRILIDSSHSVLSPTAKLSTLITELEDLGYSVHYLNSEISISKLENYSVLVVCVPYNYTEAEKNAIYEFVREGGGLLIIGEVGSYCKKAGPYPEGILPYINDLSKEFGIQFNADCVNDPSNNMPVRGCSHSKYPVITNIKDHSVTEGVDEFFLGWGCSLNCEYPSFVLARGDYDTFADENDNDYYDTDEKKGESIIVLAGCEYGKGRVIAIGDTSLWSGKYEERLDEELISYLDNKRLALNVFDWICQKEIQNPPATLSINSNPCASIYINYIYKGNTPMEIELKPGIYTIEVKKENYETYVETIELSFGEDKSISVSLHRSLSYYLRYIFGAIVIFIFLIAVIYKTKKKPEKPKEEPIEKKPEEEKPPKEASPELKRLLEEKENWREKLEKLKNQKEKLISEGVMTEEIYKQRYEEIMDQLVDIEDRIIQERMKGGKKK